MNVSRAYIGVTITRDVSTQSPGINVSVHEVTDLPGPEHLV